MLILSFDFGAFHKLLAFDDIFFWVFQISRFYNNTSVGVSGGWMNIFHPFFHEIYIGEPPQWTFEYCCGNVFLNVF